MWKKKRYNIHIQLKPEDMDNLWDACFLVEDCNSRRVDAEWFKDFVFKVHNKAVEINRR